MKFVSKYSNYRLVLKPGVSAQPMVGLAATPGVSIRFEDGIAEVTDPAYIEMIKNHQDYMVNVLPAEDPATDSFVRTNVQPEHSIQEVAYGRVMKNVGTKAPVNPELLKMVKKMAMDIVKTELPRMAKEEAMKIAPSLAMDLLKQMSADAQAEQVIEEEPKVTLQKRHNPKALNVAPEAISADEAGLSDAGDGNVDMEQDDNLNNDEEKTSKTPVKRGAGKK